MTPLLAAPSPQTEAGSNYSFVVWSDGGGASHNIIVPPTNAAFTASFLQPEIGLEANASGIDLSWPAWAAAMKLYASSNLGTPAVWSVVTDAPAMSDGLFYLEVPVTNGSRFYRLQLP
jgi:hypothetical protein